MKSPKTLLQDVHPLRLWWPGQDQHHCELLRDPSGAARPASSSASLKAAHELRETASHKSNRSATASLNRLSPSSSALSRCCVAESSSPKSSRETLQREIARKHRIKCAMISLLFFSVPRLLQRPSRAPSKRTPFERASCCVTLTRSRPKASNATQQQSGRSPVSLLPVHL